MLSWLHHILTVPGAHLACLQSEEGQWVAKEQLREKLMARVCDRPLVEVVLSTAPNKLTSQGTVFRHCPPAHHNWHLAALTGCLTERLGYSPSRLCPRGCACAPHFVWTGITGRAANTPSWRGRSLFLPSAHSGPPCSTREGALHLGAGMSIPTMGRSFSCLQGLTLA